MSKYRRKIDWNAESSPINTKRRCSLRNRTFLEKKENVLWPETDDESFFSNSKIEDLITNTTTTCSNNSSQNQINETLFGDLDLPEPNSERNLSATPLQQFSEDINCNGNISDFRVDDDDVDVDVMEKKLSASLTFTKDDAGSMSIKGDDTIFSGINLDDLTPEEQHELFADNFSYIETEVQNTQKFLDDVSFKVPKVPVKQSQNKYDNSSLSMSIIEGIVHGTQYETHEEIFNRTLLQTSAVVSAEADNCAETNVSHFNWETQAFANEIDTEQEQPFPSKGEFYGLPNKVKHLIFEHKGIKSLYEWQDECLNLPAIQKRTNLIYALPTSGGKTLVAEILMLREIICRERNVLFILPYVSIVQEKVSAMSPFAIALDFIVDEYTAGKGKCPPIQLRKRKSIFVASIEKGAVLFDSLIDAKRANEIGLVVVDELHLIGERGRGATLEVLLTKIMYVNASIQIVGMSATIGNLSEVSTFLKADVYTRGFRPVELKEYIKCGNDILEINTAGKTIEEVFVYNRTVNYKYSEAVTRADPDHLAGLVAECAPENCCLIFCFSRKNCENVAMLLSRILPKQKFLEYRQSEKVDLMDALDKVCGILSPVLAKTIPYGIAYHHSGLTTDERKFIETAYRFGVISVICCTSTLAAGVNLPAKRVIIRAPYVGVEFMTLCKYKQMVGRAGRAGFGEAGESILISSSRDNVRIGEMLFSPMDKAISSLDFQENHGLQSLILSAIGLGLADCRSDLISLINSTLLAVQAEYLGVCTQEMIINIVRDMFKNKVIQISQNAQMDKRDYSDIITTQDIKDTTTATQSRRIFIGKTTRFKLTAIGRAAFKAGIDYKRTHLIYNELIAAQKQLILTNYAHLLYLVVSFNSNATGNELFAADALILFDAYTLLDETMQMLCKMIGLTEAQAAKLAKTRSIQGPFELKFNRLFKVLILTDILNMLPLPNVAIRYNIERGMLQNLISQATSAASAIVRLCEQMDEFWCYKPLFERLSAKMDRCATIELEPLMELPAVKINRAKQLYAAGFHTIEDIAKCRPMTLVKSVEHMPLKVAKEIVSAAKIILMKKLDHLEEETEILKKCLEQDENSQLVL